MYVANIAGEILWCVFSSFCGLQSKRYCRVNTVEPRSKQKTMGDGAKGENNYQESANKKTLNDRKQKNFGAAFCRLTSDLKTCHIILSQKLERAF